MKFDLDDIESVFDSPTAQQSASPAPGPAPAKRFTLDDIVSVEPAESAPKRFTLDDIVSVEPSQASPVRGRDIDLPKEAPFDEQGFRQWYAPIAKQWNLDPNPDAPQHKYDYRQAYRAGTGPDAQGHWPSEFKAPDHPNRYVNGIDTITGKPAELAQRKPGEASIGPDPNATPKPREGALGWAIDAAAGLKDYIASLVTTQKISPTSSVPVLSPEGHKLVPFSVVEAARAAEVLDSARRIRDGNGTAADERIVMEYAEADADVPQEGGRAFGYKVGQTAAMIVPFGIEFAMTGGAYTAGKRGAEVAARKLLGDAIETVAKNRAARLAGRGARALVGATAQAAVQVPRIAEGTLTRQTQAALENKDDGFIPAFAKAFPDTFVEIASERTGAVVSEPLAKFAKTAMGQKATALKAAVMERWLGLHPGSTAAEFLDRVRSEAGWNGILGEVFEERVGEVARYALPGPLSDGGPAPASVRLATGEQADPNKPVEDPRAAAAKELGAQLALEASAFALPGAARAVIERATRPRQAPVPVPPQAQPTSQPAAPATGTPAGDLAGQTAIQPPPPPVAPQAPSQAQQPPAGVPFMITGFQRMELRSRGYTDEQINAMTPADAQAILTQQGAPAAPPTVRSESTAQNVPPQGTASPPQQAETLSPAQREEALKGARVRAYEQVKGIADPEEMALTYERMVDQYLLEAGIQPFPRPPFAQAMFDLDVAEQDAQQAAPPVQPEAPAVQPEADAPQPTAGSGVEGPISTENRPSAPAVPSAGKSVEDMTDEELWALTEQDYANESDHPAAEPEPADVKPKKAKKPPVNVTKFKDLPADVRSQVRRIHRELQEFKFDQPGRQDVPWWDQGANEATVGSRLPNAEVWKNFNEESRRTGRALINSIENYMRGDRATTIHPDIVRLAEARASGDLELSGWTLPHDAGDVGVIRAKPIREGKPDEAKEREVIEALERRDIDELRTEYEAKFGKTYNADNMSELLGVHEGDERWKHHDAVRSAAGAAVQVLYNRALQDPIVGARDTIRFMGGGTGSGKSTGIPADRTVIATLDSTLSNYEQTKANIEHAKATGHYVAVVYVWRDPHDAFGSVINRAVDPANGRPVSILSHASTHVNGPKTLQRLFEDYASDPAVSINVVENVRPGEQVVRTPEWLAEKAQAYTDVSVLRTELETELARAVGAGDVSAATAAALGLRTTERSETGGSARGEAPQDDAGQPAQPARTEDEVGRRRNAIGSNALEKAWSVLQTETQRPPSTPERERLIARIAAASREPVMDIVEATEVKATDGKWYNPLANSMPWGVRSAEPREERSLGFVYRNRDGATVGKRFESREAAKASWEATQDRKVAQFIEDLRGMSDERLQGQRAHFLKEGDEFERREAERGVSATVKKIREAERKGRSATGPVMSGLHGSLGDHLRALHRLGGVSGEVKSIVGDLYDAEQWARIEVRESAERDAGGGQTVANFEEWGLAPDEAAATMALAEAMDFDTSKLWLVKGGKPGVGALPQASRAQRLIDTIRAYDFDVELYDETEKRWVAEPVEASDAARSVGRKAERAMPQAAQVALDQLNTLPYDEVNAVVAGVDLYETGEKQPRLPGAENVREQEVELPPIAEAQGSFTLEGGADERTAVQETLFGPPSKPAKAKTAKPRKEIPGQNVLFQAAENAPAMRKWYYSNIEAALTTWQKKGTPDQLTAHLKKFKGANDEATEIGLDEWLKGRESVTRDEVREFLDRSRIEVQEVTRSDVDPYDSPEVAEALSIIRNHGFDVQADGDPGDVDNQVYLAEDGEPVDVDEKRAEIPSAVLRAWDVVQKHEGAIKPTKFAQYQLPGGENYREVLLTLPRPLKMTDEYRALLRRLNETEDAYGDNQTDANRTTRDLAYARVLQYRLDHGKKEFQSGHWEEPNVLAHIRLNDRKVDGKRVLFVEEIQSDWHQQGRKKGYESDAKALFAELARLEEEHTKALSDLAKSERLTITEAERVEFDARESKIAELKSQKAKFLQTVPDAPFKGNAWKKLAMKRVLAYAAERGYDGIAWTTGRQQNERYKLSTVVDGIQWMSASFFEGGRDVTLRPKNAVAIDFTVEANGNIRPTSSSAARFAGKKIDEVVGKDLAKRIMDEQEGDLKGQDMDLGGSGMVGFYDRELPNLANDLVKKHGGKVGRIALTTRTTKSTGMSRSDFERLAEEANIDSGDYGAVSEEMRNGKSVEDALRDIEADEALSAEAIEALWEVVDNAVSLFGDEATVESTDEVHYLELPVSLREEIRAKGLPLFQGEKAAVEFVEGGQALIRAMASPDVSSAVHELAHVARRFLFDRNIPAEQREGISDEDIRVAEEWAAAVNGDWSVNENAPEEKFARGFERYLQGASPIESLNSLFAKFKAWLGRIYETLAGSSIDIKISPEMRNVYDKLVTRKAARERKEAAKNAPKVDQILSPGAAADQFKLGERVVYDGKQYIVQGRAADRLRLRPLGQSEANERQVDARNVQSYSEQLLTRTVEQPPAKAKKAPKADTPAQPDGVHKSQWRKIGQNADGETLYEDDRGVRSKVSNGFRLTEAVGMHHVRQPDGSTLIQPVIGNRRNDYKLTSELEESAETHPTTETQIEEPKTPTTREELAQAQSDVDAEIDDLFKQIAAKIDNTATSGVDPELGLLMIKLVRAYIKKGVLEFRVVALNVQEKLGQKARTLDRHLELAWKRLRNEDVKVADVLTAGATLEGETQDGRPADDAGGGREAGAGDAGEPAGGDRGGRPDDLAGEQPESEEGPREESQPGGKRRPPRRPRTGRAGTETAVGGDAVRDRAGADTAAHVDTADTAQDPDVADANARGERPRHFVISDEAILTEGTWVKKLDDNVAALELLKQLDTEQRPASDEEQRVLARYIGWGHTNLAPVVGPLDARAGQRDAKVVQARQKLEQLLTPAEFKELGESVINAHYSFNLLPRTIWEVVGRLGFKGGSVLEPAIGTGHFFGTMPLSMVQHPKTRLFGVDKEPIAARIAKQLYQGAYIQNSPLEDATIPKDYFDLQISNVPFGNVPIFDPAFVSGERQVVTKSLHNYYFGKAGDSGRPGGLVAFVTSRYTMDSESDAVRRYLANRFEFLGAIRLTDQAFKSTAGTSVVTDVIFLRRYEAGETPKDVKWLKAVERDDVSKRYRNEEHKAVTNEYFVDHPEMVMGKESMEGSMARTPEPQYTVEGPTTAEGLAAAVARFPQGVYKATKKPPRKLALDQRVDTKQGSLVWKDGKLYHYDQGTLTESTMKGRDLERAKAFIPIRDAYQTVLDVLMSLGDNATLEAAQAKLRAAYDKFVGTGKKDDFGLVNKPENRRVIERDPNGPRVLALEDAVRVTKKGERTFYKLKRLADIFSKRVAAPPKEPTSADTPKDALVQSLAWRATVDLDYMQALTGKTAGELTDALVGDIFQDPISNGWVTRDEYLSGDVVTKLAQAEARAQVDTQFAGNVEALKVVQPKRKEPEEFKAPLGATWVPLDVYQQFMTETLKPNVTPTITLTNNEARVEFHVGTSYGKHEFLPEGENLSEWFEDALNNKLPVKYSGTGKDRAKDPAKTERYRESLAQLREAWEQWWLTEPDVSHKLADIYNAMFNREADRVFDGQHLVIPNMSPLIKPRPWQKNVVWRAIQNGNTGVFHAVGSGKTIAISMIAGELKRLGLANKPIIAVPNPLVKQWTDAFLAVYPTARILAPTAKDFQAKNRRTFIAKVANNDWDAIIIAHSQFESISVKVETLKAFIQQQEDLLLADASEQMGMSVDSFKELVDKYENEDEDAKKLIGGRGTPRSVKDIVKAILRLRVRLKKRLDQQKKDAPVVFEELGIDALLVDEAHYFKNLYFPTSRNNIAGLKGSDSDRAMDMYLKVRLINQASNNRNVFFATGTPIANTMSEVYTMFRYLAQSTLDRLGMGGFDSWANNYATASAEMEAAPGGGYKERNRLRNWSNLRDLSKLFRRFADVFTAKDVEKTGLLKLPKIKNGTPTVIATNPHPQYEAFNTELNGRIKDIQSGRPQSRLNAKGEFVDDNNLWITSDAAKAAIDLRLVASVPEDPNGRIPTAARKIAEVYNRTKDQSSTQFVFMDIGVPDPKTLPPLPKHVLEGTVEEDVLTDDEDEPSDEPEDELSNEEIENLNAGSRDLYSDLRRNLEKQGVKPDEIAFHHQARNPTEEALLFQAVREGRIRVLVSTRAKGGVGVNVQNKMVALHHLDVPWRPDQLEQADGRGIRQGNENEEVEIYRYVTKKTFDEFRWGLLAIKNAQILAFQRGEIDSMEDLDPSQLDLTTVQAIASGDPRKLDLMNKERALRLLVSRYSNFERRQQASRRDMAAAESRKASVQAWYDQASKVLEGIQTWAEKPTVDFLVERGGSQGYGYLSPRKGEPLAMDWSTTEGRKAVSDRIISLISDHNLYSPQIIAKAGPFQIWASKAQGEEVHEGGQLIQAVGGTDVSVKLGERVIGVAPTWMKADKEPPKYNVSLQAHLNVGKLEEDVRKTEKLLTVYDREIASAKEILTKTFPQQAELDAMQKEVSALRVAIGIDKANPVDVAMAELAKIVEEHDAGTIDSDTAKKRAADVYQKARDGKYIEKLEQKVAERADRADADEGGAAAPRRRAGGPSGGTEAAEGRFSDEFEPTPGALARRDVDEWGLSETRHAAFPEMLELAKLLIGTPSIARAFRKIGKVAEFSTKGIRLHAGLFKKGMERQLAKALAHEIGHLKDWLPSHTLKRGNLLGRLFTLDRYLKWTFTDRDGKTIKNKAVRAELIALSDRWRPWDPAEMPESYRAYRHSSKELYADAISVLLNNPGLLEREAPIFYETFLKELDRKPEAKQAYLALQNILTGTPEELTKRRRGNIQAMLDEGDEKAIDSTRRKIEAAQESAKDLWFNLKTQVLDKNMPFLEREKATEASGVKLAPEARVRYLLEERNYIGGQLKAFTERYMLPIYEALTDADISWRTFGEALLYERIMLDPKRSEIANPLGIGPNEAEDMLRDLKESLTESQRQILEESLRQFRTTVKGVTFEAYKLGLITDESWKEIQANPAYATYRVIDYLEDDVSWKIYRQKGTLKDIQNPADATLLKSLATIRAIERQRMILGAIKFLETHHDADIQDAPMQWNGSTQVPTEPKKGSGQSLIYYYDKGKLRGKWVPENIANSLNNLSIGQNNAIVEALRFVNSKWFRPVFTTMNLGFQSFNVMRDFWRTWKNAWKSEHGTLTLGRAVLRYWQAIPMAKVRAFGLKDKPSQAELQAYEDLLDAEEAKILSVTYNDLFAGRIVENTQIEDTLTKVGVGNFNVRQEHHAALKPVYGFLDWMAKVGDFIETLPKAAMIQEYKHQGMTPGTTRRVRSMPADQRSHIRRKIGSPDFLAGGTWKPMSNELFLFSNAIIQAIRANVEVATDPNSRASFWWKTAALNIVPKAMLFAGLLAAAGWDDDDEGLDDWLARSLRGISEYDFTNYIPIPLGVDSKGNSIYLRMPQDDGGRLVGGVFWKSLFTMTGRKEFLAGLGQIVDYTAGQTPALTPILSVPADLTQYLAGTRVYDPFRNRFLFTEDEARAGGWKARWKFLRYEFQKLGGSIFMKVDLVERPRERTTAQVILESPLISNTVGRWLRISNYGEIERLRQAADPEKQKAAQVRESERDAVADAIADLMRGSEQDREQPALHAKATELVEQLYADADQAEKNRQRGDILRKLRMGVARGSDDPIVSALMSVTPVAEKVAILRQARSTMSATEFDDWLAAARDQGVISDAVAEELEEAEAVEAE